MKASDKAVHVDGKTQFTQPTHGPLPERSGTRAANCTKGEVIGETTYDLQTNSSTGGRMLAPGGSLLGELAATWTGSTDAGGTWPDRGAFYQRYDGSAWAAAPTASIESVRTGWPAIVKTQSSEIVFSHDPAASHIVMNKRSGFGSGAWTETTNVLSGIWPRAVARNGNDTVHVITANYMGGNGNMYMLYHRSPDAGATWDIVDMRLPGVDTASGMLAMGGDAYAMVTSGNTVAISAGNSNNNWGVWKSTDRGTTWTHTVVMNAFPFGWDGHQHPFLDVDLDGSQDTVETTDGSHGVMIDNFGVVHAWAGYTRVTDADSLDGWSFFPGFGALMYWNEGRGTAPPTIIATVEDVDMSGDLNGIGGDITGSYGSGLTTSPSPVIDIATGNIYLFYTSAVEFSDIIGDPTDATAQSYRDVYGMYTTDTGATWNGPWNMTNTACQHQESVFPQVVRSIVSGKLHLTYQIDGEPGISVGDNADHAVGTAEIVYWDVDPTDFAAELPTASFTCVQNYSTGYTIFSNESCGFACAPGSCSWDFDDPASGAANTSTLCDPTHTFAQSGTYNVCLTVSNPNGTDTYCKTVGVALGTEENELLGGLNFFPNPTTGLLNIEIGNLSATNAEIVLFNSVGQKVDGLPRVELIEGNNVTIDLSNYADGLYFLQFKTDLGEYTHSITLSR